MGLRISSAIDKVSADRRGPMIIDEAASKTGLREEGGQVAGEGDPGPVMALVSSTKSTTPAPSIDSAGSAHIS